MCREYSLICCVLHYSLVAIYSSWWPMFVLIFYLLSPVPTLISRRFAEAVEASSALVEVCIFITTCIVVSAYGLPIVLAHAPSGAIVSWLWFLTVLNIHFLWKSLFVIIRIYSSFDERSYFIQLGLCAFDMRIKKCNWGIIIMILKRTFADDGE